MNEPTEVTGENLVQAARAAMSQAYAPYSKFLVGAALLTGSGQVITGVNVENASYGLTICAERVAVFKAASEGVRKITKIAIVSSSGEATFPCGACRQVLHEFSDDMSVLTQGGDGRVRSNKLAELLPHSFGPEDLE